MGSKRCGGDGRAWTHSVFCAPCLPLASVMTQGPACPLYLLPSLLALLYLLYALASHALYAASLRLPSLHDGQQQDTNSTNKTNQTTRPTKQIKHHDGAGGRLSKGRRAWGAAKLLLTHVSCHMAGASCHIARHRLHKLLTCLTVARILDRCSIYILH